MSTSLSANCGSRDRLKLRTRCGWSWCACQMRCTERSEMPAALAIARPVQCVASCGGSPQVSATTRATVSAAIGGLPGLRVLSRSRPSTPSSAKRCCQRQTIGRLTPTCVAICCTGPPPAEARTTCARSMCLRCRLRSLVISSSRCLSSVLTPRILSVPSARFARRSSRCESAQCVRAEGALASSA